MLTFLPYALAAYGGYKGYKGAKEAGASGLGRLLGGYWSLQWIYFRFSGMDVPGSAQHLQQCFTVLTNQLPGLLRYSTGKLFFRQQQQEVAR